MAQMRAIEFGKPMLFVSNTGITANINAAGVIQKSLIMDTQSVLKAQVQLTNGQTPLAQWGFYPLMLLLLLLGIVGCVLL